MIALFIRLRYVLSFPSSSISFDLNVNALIARFIRLRYVLSSPASRITIELNDGALVLVVFVQCRRCHTWLVIALIYLRHFVTISASRISFDLNVSALTSPSLLVVLISLNFTFPASRTGFDLVFGTLVVVIIVNLRRIHPWMMLFITCLSNVVTFPDLRAPFDLNSRILVLRMLVRWT